MTKLGKLIVAFIIIIIAGVVWGVVSFEQASDGPIKIGVIAPLSGVAADFGEDIQRGVASVLIPGVEFMYEDSVCDNTKTLSVFQKLTEFDGVQFLIGPGCGSPQEVITSLLKDKEILAVVPSAASEKLYEQSGEHFFNVQYGLEDESTFIAKTMYDQGYTSVALISYQNAFSKTYADSFREAYAGEIVEDSVFLDETADLASELLKIKQSGAQAVYAPDISFFFSNGLVELERFGVDVPVFATYVVELPAVRELVEGVSYSFPRDITSGEGAVFDLSKKAAEVLGSKVRKCEGEFTCVLEALQGSDMFDENGISTHSMILKKIEGGVPVAL